MLASQDECEIAKEMPSQGKDVCSENVTLKSLRPTELEDPEKKNMSCFETKCKQIRSVSA